jgi:peptidoglycan hydrolase-like protein with peptidoglycan-binding domain
MSGVAAPRRGRGLRRTVGVVLAMAVVGAAVSAVWFAVAARPSAVDSATVPVRTGTAAVTRGTVTARVSLGGTLGFDGSYSVVHQGAPGVLTAVAEQGATVSRGGSLYAVANQPVRLLYGATPAYREFAAGMSDGPDVRQLEENLIALRMAGSQQLTVDERFTAATAAAIRRWQAAWGLPAAQRTGALSQGQVVFAAGALRVSQAQAVAGTSVGPNEPVLSATSTIRVVTAQVTAERQHLVHVGDQVIVSLTDLSPVPGTVTRIGRVATEDTSSGGGSASPPATLPVTISVTLPAGAADLDQAPAQVDITTQTHENVLMVPATALLARPGGGYQVRLESGRNVQVEPGLFDTTAGTVEVTGDLTVGQRVRVPAT